MLRVVRRARFFRGRQGIHVGHVLLALQECGQPDEYHARGVILRAIGAEDIDGGNSNSLDAVGDDVEFAQEVLSLEVVRVPSCRSQRHCLVNGCSQPFGHVHVRVYLGREASELSRERGNVRQLEQWQVWGGRANQVNV